MQTVTTNYTDTLKKGISLSAKVSLIAEWNMNRFAGPVVVVNTGITNGDSDEFPLESIVSPNRPTKDGIVKARTITSARYNAPSQPRGPSTLTGSGASVQQSLTAPIGVKGYTVSSEAKYKYWASSTVSAASLVSGGYAITGTDLELTYTADIWTNKIVLNFEANASIPRNITVSYKTTAAGAYTAITGTWQVDSDGKVVIYRQANDTWGATEYNLNPMVIRGLKVSVGQMSRPSSTLEVIEVSARLQVDLSDFVVDYGTAANMSEASLVSPLGVCSSNEYNITLSNIDGRFDNAMVNLRDTIIPNLFWGLIDKNIYMKMDIGLLVNGSYEWTRAFTGWSDEWGTPGEDTTTVSLKDSSKILQEAKPNETLYQGISTAGIVWRMCDAVGFNNYDIPLTPLKDDAIIDFYWTDKEKTIWEHFQDIAQATQTAIYFDEYDTLKVLPREAAYDTSKSVSWTFDSEVVPSGVSGRAADAGKLADIIDFSPGYDYEANIVNVKYTPTAVSKMNGNLPVMTQAWAPEGTVALRASRLVQTLTNVATAMRISSTEVKLWPFTGNVQIEGEIIKYRSKGYTYRNAAGAWISTYVASEEERLKLDAQNPNLSWANYYNGYLDITGGRGQWGTFAAGHSVDISGYLARYRTGAGAVRTWNGGLVHDKENGLLTLQTNKTFTPNSWYVATRGSTNDSPPYWYGTRMRFPTSGYGYGAAGIAMTVGTNDSGYYCEIVRTVAISANDRAKYTYELCFYVKYIDGHIKRIGPSGGKGVALNVVAGQWYDMDVHFEWQGSTRVVSIMVNGVTRLTASVPVGIGTGESIGGRYGLFTRGWTACQFEYLYSSTYAVNDAFDQEGWFDRIQGGYQSSQYDREWTYGYRTNTKLRYKKPPLKVTSRYGSRMMDEYGPVVHEIREYDVDFEEKPMIHSNLYFSNDRQVICPEYIATPFGAKFLLANTARVNAIVNGEDTLTYGIDNPVTQAMLIYGRQVVTEEVGTETVRNDAAVNRRGAVELDVESPWIQSKTTAQAIGAWITKHWAGGSDEINVEITGNPLIQLGDLVAVHYPDKAFAYSTHRYFVVGIEHSFDGALETSVTLRRAKV